MRNNIFTTLLAITKNLNESTITKLQKNIDATVEKYNEEGGYKPLVLPSENHLIHSKSERYNNGNLVPNYCVVNADNVSEDELREMEELADLFIMYSNEAVRIINYMKSLGMQLVLLTDFNSNELHQLALDILPDFILNDTNLLSKSDLDKDEIHDLQNHVFKYAHGFISDEIKDQFFEDLRDNEVFELMYKYYALDLLTNY